MYMFEKGGGEGSDRLDVVVEAVDDGATRVVDRINSGVRDDILVARSASGWGERALPLKIQPQGLPISSPQTLSDVDRETHGSWD